MTKRDRVINSLQHKQTDIIPHNIDLTQHARQNLIDFLGSDNVDEVLENHIDSAYYDGFLKPDGDGFMKDDFGVRWLREGTDGDIGIVTGQVLQEPDSSLIKMPDIREEEIRSRYQALTAKDDGLFKCGMIGFSMFERAWTMRGMESFLSDMLLEPDFADDLLDAICEHNLKIIDVAVEYNIDCFHFGDDWGQQKGLIMGPALWRRFIKPRVARMYDRVHSKGLFVSQHSCGDISDIFGDLVDIGLNMYQTFQPEIYDCDWFKREYGNHLTIWGGISTQRLLPFASPDEIKHIAGDFMRKMGAGGGLVAAPTHSIPGDVSGAQIMALVELFTNQNKYL